jgi:cytochrome b561
MPAGPRRYAPALRWLHWITAGLIAAMFVLGLWVAYLAPADGAFRHRLYNLHESTGLTILALTLLRLAVRLATGAPRLPAGTAPAIRAAATLNHLGLYALLLAMPVIGFLNANAAGAPLVWYEAVAVPSPIGKQPDPVAHAISGAHWWGALLLFLLIGLHVAGAAYHGLVRRDGVLRHMF